MNKTVRNTGLALLAAGALVYPAILLYRYIRQRNAANAEGQEDNHKAFIPALRGHHKPHRRKAEANGHMAN